MDDRVSSSYPVFIRQGDALDEADRLVAELGGETAAGLHRRMFVERARQTVVMVTSRDAPLAAALRASGWAEPRE